MFGKKNQGGGGRDELSPRLNDFEFQCPGCGEMKSV